MRIPSQPAWNVTEGEIRTLTIEAETKDVGTNPTLLIDGYNVKVEPVEQPVAVLLNRNAQPMH